MAVAAGLISIHFVNAAGSLLVAPFGGTGRRMSTNPFCVGVLLAANHLRGQSPPRPITSAAPPPAVGSDQSWSASISDR